jgi:UDP-2,3-diacylglucosamine pyrophosphatase LpxH
MELLKTLRALSEHEDTPGKPRYENVDLYINGDLTDIPLHKAHAGADEPDDMIFDDKYGGSPVGGQAWEGVFPTSLDVILGTLRAIVRDQDPRLRIFYMTGNHDIGISGLRYFRADAHRQPPKPPDPKVNVLDLPAHAVWNPGGIIQTRGKWVYFEHGHLHDPVLWLYLRYATLDLLRGGSRRQERQLLGRVQRNGQVGQNALDGSEQDGKSAYEPNDSWLKDYITLQIARRYRHAARRTARWLHYLYGDMEFTIVFGHTHIEDRMTFQYKGTDYTYINAGSWAGNQGHQTFWIVAPDGEVEGPLQWPA